MNTSAFKILSKLYWFTRWKLGIAAFLSVKPLSETENIISKNNANQKKFHVQTQTNEKEKGGNFEIINLDLEPHLVTPLLSNKGGHRVTPMI